MDNCGWYKIKDIAKFLNISENRLRKLIDRAEFNEFCIFKKPFKIFYCDRFCKLINQFTYKSKIIYNKKQKKEKINNNKVISNKIYNKWTQSAIDCYKIGCNCEICDINKMLDLPCQMKQVVKKLVQQYGIPDKLIKIMEEKQNEQV